MNNKYNILFLVTLVAVTYAENKQDAIVNNNTMSHAIQSNTKPSEKFKKDAHDEMVIFAEELQQNKAEINQTINAVDSAKYEKNKSRVKIGVLTALGVLTVQFVLAYGAKRIFNLNPRLTDDLMRFVGWTASTVAGGLQGGILSAYLASTLYNTLWSIKMRIE